MSLTVLTSLLKTKIGKALPRAIHAPFQALWLERLIGRAFSGTRTFNYILSSAISNIYLGYSRILACS